MTTTNETIKDRLEYLRGEIKAERISCGELSELQSLTAHIAPDDVELLEWAGVKEGSGKISKNEFAAICGEYLIAPDVALENENIVSALRDKAGERAIRELLASEF